ncbi:hypothetical protein P8876_20915, partial [Bacillus haynesii]|nr:hypothetical protein [Bacillus haynesii]
TKKGGCGFRGPFFNMRGMEDISRQPLSVFCSFTIMGIDFDYYKMNGHSFIFKGWENEFSFKVRGNSSIKA